MFVIKVWVAKDGQEFQLAIERLIDLRKLAYLGTLVSVNYITYVTYIYIWLVNAQCIHMLWYKIWQLIECMFTGLLSEV